MLFRSAARMCVALVSAHLILRQSLGGSELLCKCMRLVTQRLDDGLDRREMLWSARLLEGIRYALEAVDVAGEQADVVLQLAS